MRYASRLGLSLALTLAVSASQVVAEEPRPTNTDCGVYALFVLFEIQGRPVTLEALDRALPPRHPEGYSMAELARASRALGLTLTGSRFDRGDAPLDGPAIAFVKEERAGHFVVLRPVGTTGTMVQVIDPPYAPRVVDVASLIGSAVWTGRVLTVDRPRSLGKVAYPVSAATGLVLLAIVARRRGRRVVL